MAQKIGKYKVSNRENTIYIHDENTATAATYKATDYVYAEALRVGTDSDPGPGKAVIDGTLTQTGVATFAAVPVFSAGVIGNKVTVQSGTGAEDLTSTASDLVWIASTTQAGDITLPQATSGNAGMVIKVLAGADWSDSAFKLGFANGGSTVMFGMLNVAANNAQDVVETFPITNNAKALTIDSDDVTGAGGAKGSQYTFTYISANLVHVEAHGKITTGTVAPDAGASVTAGI